MSKTVEIALVGKYTSQQDTYTSIIKSLEHAGFVSNRKVIIKVSGHFLPVSFKSGF